VIQPQAPPKLRAAAATDRQSLSVRQADLMAVALQENQIPDPVQIDQVRVMNAKENLGGEQRFQAREGVAGGVFAPAGPHEDLPVPALHVIDFRDAEQLHGVSATNRQPWQWLLRRWRGSLLQAMEQHLHKLVDLLALA